MLYVAFFLVIAGFIILGYSIYMTYAKAPRNETSDAQKGPVPASADTPHPVARKAAAPDRGVQAFDAVHPVVPSQVIGEMTTETLPESAAAPATAAPVPEQARVPEPQISSPPPKQPEPEADHWAVLFDDASGMIDYSGSTGKINPQPEAYRNLKRIGRGKIVYEKEGISFYSEQKIFRYDFHRVRTIKTGDAHLAVFLIGQEAVKLFIFEAPDPIISRIGGDFKVMTEHVR